MNAQLVVDFSANKTEGCGSVEVVFNNASLGVDSGTTYSWDLGGQSSTRENPGRIFERPGKYTICLTVTTSNGTAQRTCKNDYIVVFALPKVDFSVDKNKGCSPLEVQFKNTSTSENNIKSITWDVGGTANVISTNNIDSLISSTYTKGGKYTTSLTVTDDKNCINTLVRRDVIEVLSPIEVIPTKQFLKTCGLPWEVEIKNNNIDPAVIYSWDFGNGLTYSGANPPVVIYDRQGSFDLTVEARQGQCKEVFTFPGFVNTEESAVIDFSVSNPCVGESVSFEDKTTLGADSLQWFIDDVLFSNKKSFSTSFQDGGCHAVLLKRYRKDCIDSIRLACYNVKEKPAIQVDIKNQFTCEVPANLEFSASGDYELTWIFYGMAGPDTLKGNSQNYSVARTGDYKMDLIYKDGQACTYKLPDIPVKVEQFEVRLPTLGPGGCVGTNILLLDSIYSQLPIVYQKWEVLTTPPQIFINQRPLVRTDSIGQYDVILTVENSIGCRDTIQRTSYLKVGTPPIVDFVAQPLDDCLIVGRQFTDSSIGLVNEWYWDFGDSTTSVLQNPLHQYNSFGKFDISLAAGYNGCFSSKKVFEYITVHPPKASFNLIVDCADPRKVEIKNTSALGDQFFWTVDAANGDHYTTSDSTIGNYEFQSLGEIAITLWTKNDSTGCEHFTTDTFLLELPHADYTLDTTRGCAPFEIHIDTLAINADSTFLFFEDMLQTDTTLSLATEGEYESPLFIVQDKYGCRDSFQLADKIYGNTVTAIPIFEPIICAPDELILIDSSYATFADIKEIVWDVGGRPASGFLDTLFFDQKGVHDLRIKVTDSWSCEAELFIPGAITVVNLKPDFRADSLGCTGVSIRFIPSGNDANTDRFLWEFGDGKTAMDQVTSNEYNAEGNFDVCLTMFDARGCESKICKPEYVKIRNPKALYTADPLASPCPPLITNFINQSTNAIAYEWDFGDNTGISRNLNPSHVYTEPDTFSVRLIAIRSATCSDTFEIVDLIKLEGPKAAIKYEISGNCLPINIEMSALSDKAYTYFWDFGNGDVDTTAGLVESDTVFYSFTTPGIYLPKLVVQDARGCKRIFSSESIEVNAVSAEFSVVEDSICGLDTRVELTNQSASTSGVLGFEWFVTGPDFELGSFDVNPSFATDNSGLFDILLISSSPNCKDTANMASVFEVFHNPVAVFQGVSSTLCADNRSQFTNLSSIPLGDIVNNSWTISDTLVSDSTHFMTSFSNAGVYKINLVVTSNAGCIDSMDQNVVIQEGITISLPTDSIICLDNSIPLIASIKNAERVSMFGWSKGDSNLCYQCIDVVSFPNVSGYYTFKVSTIEQCIYEDSLLITVVPVPYPSPMVMLDDTICDGTELIMGISNLENDWIVRWMNEQRQVLCDTCLLYKEVLVDDKNYIIEVENAFGCKGDTSQTVNVEKSVDDFLVDAKFICEGALTSIAIDSHVFKPTWWVDGKGFCNDCLEIEIQPIKDVLVEVMVTSAEGCEYIDSLEIELVPPTALSMPPDTLVCLGQTVLLNAMGPGIPLWETDNRLDATNKLAPIVNATSPGIYTLKLQYDECLLTDSVFVDVIAELSAEAIGDTVCFGDLAFLEVEGNALEYLWYKNNELISRDTMMHVIGNTSDTYFIVAKRKGCSDLTLPSELLVHPEIIFDFERHVYRMDLNSQIQVESTADNFDRYDYIWSDPNGLSCDDCPEPFIYGIEDRTTYQLNVSDKLNKCAIEDSIRIRVTNECTDKGFYRPNIIHLNAQNAGNNEFKMTALDVSEFKRLEIFDRWGEKVFSSEDVAEGWDGRFLGKKVISGVYVYRVEALCPELNEFFSFVGNVTVVE